MTIIRNLRRKLVAPVLVAVAAVAICSCYSGNPTGPRTAVVGDSITNMSRDAIGSAIGGTYGYEVEANNGYTIRQGEAELQTVISDAQGAPSMAVINLGTNDAVLQNADWQTDYNNLIAELQPVRCVILTTLVGTVNIGRPDNIGDKINAAIAQTVADNPGHFYVDNWGGYADVTPGMLSPFDGVHPTSLGESVIAFFDSLALRGDCGTS